jgi:uracil-DNA glycosylase family 4
MSGRSREALLEQVRFLHELGVEAIRLPERSPAAHSGPGRSLPSTAEQQSEVKPPLPLAGALGRVREEMGECTRCGLAASRTHIVFGVGDPSADLMFVGEGPGQEEDQRGEPFVGRAGQLLDRMIAAIGLQREQVYIANIVKCRPPENRNPQEDEIRCCIGFLEAQIQAVEPRAIVALGKVAASVLLGESIAITRCRGQLRSYQGIPLMPTYHPAYLLRQYTRENRQAVFDDLLAVKALVDQARNG